MLPYRERILQYYETFLEPGKYAVEVSNTPGCKSFSAFQTIAGGKSYAVFRIRMIAEAYTYRLRQIHSLDLLPYIIISMKHRM